MTKTAKDMTTKNITAKDVTANEVREEERGQKGYCFAKRKGKCEILDRTACCGCTFYQTAEELAQGRNEAQRRLDGLPEQKREYIRLKYVLKR